jgi:indolepyruvate ferredoxin oxidoreductase beta subunit
VGGQGVLFITRLLAEAAIEKGLPVFTSETHGMAQRGGTVISHLKVGRFAGPLIRPGRADGLIALKPESLNQHAGYLKPDGWVAVNQPEPLDGEGAGRSFAVDADRLVQTLGNPKALNLLMVGFALSRRLGDGGAGTPLYCGVDDIAAILKTRLQGKDRLLDGALLALKTGAQSDVRI